MNKLNVTKGEWKAIDNGHYIDIHAFDDNGYHFSQVCIGVSHDESNNAPLIAQAKNMYRFLDDLANGRGVEYPIEQLLAKCRGES